MCILLMNTNPVVPWEVKFCFCMVVVGCRKEVYLRVRGLDFLGNWWHNVQIVVLWGYRKLSTCVARCLVLNWSWFLVCLGWYLWRSSCENGVKWQNWGYKTCC